MKKKEIVQKNSDFNKIIETGECKKNRYFVIYALPNKEKQTHYGISAGTKIGHAVTRNHLKRQVRNIIDHQKFFCPKGKDYIIIVRKSCLDVSFLELEKSFIHLISQFNDQKGERNEEKK